MKSTYTVAVYILILSVVILSGCVQSNTDGSSSSSPSSSEDYSGVSGNLATKHTPCPIISIPIYENRPYTVYKDIPTQLRYTEIDEGSQALFKGNILWNRYFVNLKNIDSESGIFTVIFTIYPVGIIPDVIVTKTLMPGETAEFMSDYDRSKLDEIGASGGSKIVPGTKIVSTPTTEYRNELTGYRQEQKCSYN